MTTLNRFAPATRDNPAGYQTREITITREAAADGEALRIAFSSEAPVERYDWRTGETYLEVLDHSPGAVDLSYAKDGLPFCLDHNLSRMIGLLEDVTIDEDRVGRGVFRKGNHPDAEWAAADMATGIRKKISFGYWPGDNYTQDKRADGVLVRTYRGWAPYEASSVPVPADYDMAGVGRSAPGASASQDPFPVAGEMPSTKESTMDPVSTPAQGTAPAPDNRAVERLATIEREATRKSAMLQLGEAAGLTLAEVNAFIQSEKTPDQMGRELLTKAAEKLREQPKAVVLTEKEQKDYSFARLITGLANDERAGFEFEVSDEIAKRMGRPGKGSVYYPTTGDGPFAVATGKRTQLSFAAGAGKGGELKFTEYAGFAEALRARMVLGRTQAQFVNGLQGDFALTVQTGAGSFVWGAETANAALSSLTIAQRLGQPKVGQSATSFTRQFMRQSAEAVEPLVRRDLLAIHGRGVETAAYNGSGAANNPRGVLNTAGVNLVALGANGAAPTYNMTVDMETEVAADNADADAMAFITTTRVRGTLRKTQVFSGTNGAPVWTGGRDGELLGYPAYATNLMPGNLTKGTSNGICHAAIFGDFSSLYVLEWGAAELMVDPITNGPAIIRVLSYQLIDILVRYPESFTIVNDILP
jgi:hypothetical protein